MTRNDVLRMAREAGIPDDNIPRLCHGRLETGVELLERFAALVAAAEREACADVCDNLPVPQSCSGVERSLWDVANMACSEAIRARGDK